MTADEVMDYAEPMLKAQRHLARAGAAAALNKHTDARRELDRAVEAITDAVQSIERLEARQVIGRTSVDLLTFNGESPGALVQPGE